MKIDKIYLYIFLIMGGLAVAGICLALIPALFAIVGALQ